MSLQRTATIVSSITALLLLTIKFFVGIFSGSIAVLSSAIDSLLDLCVSSFNYFAIKNAEKPADKMFNYGRGKFEALATFIEGSIIILSGCYIMYESVMKIIYEEPVVRLGISIIVMMISIIITGTLVTFLEYVAKKTDNMVIAADALHYKTDLYTNGGILLSLGVIYLTGFYLIDAIIGILIAIYIMWSAFALVKKGFLHLLDASLSDEQVEMIKEIFHQEKRVTSYHFLRTRRSGNKRIVDAHLVFDKDISLLEAHAISDRVEQKISKLDMKKGWIFNFHLDPYDDSQHEEENHG